MAIGPIQPSFGQMPGLGQLPGTAQATGPTAAPNPGGEASNMGFGDILKDAVLNKPSRTQSAADTMATQFAAGGSIDPHQLAIASAKASVEIQMSTRSISQAVSAVRTLMQMQV